MLSSFKKEFLLEKIYLINPFEQFEIFIVGYLTTLSITYYNLFLFFCCLFLLNLNRIKILISFFQMFLKTLYDFNLSLINQHIGIKNAMKFFSFITSLFLFILLCNFIGLLPYGFTITSHMLVTFCLSISIFIAITIYGIVNHLFKFFLLFIPSNVPVFLLGFIILIEILSYFIRPFSLGIRLFANLLSGHTLLNLLSSFVFYLWNLFIFLAFIPFLFIFIIFGLEFAIAFIQSYVFVVLTCIYIADSYNVVHE